MKTIPIDQIVISPNRQRKEFDAAELHQFADGIATRGLLHAIILRTTVEGTYVLVAGERRLRAIQDLSSLGQAIKHDGEVVALGSIPYTLLEELDPLAYEEAELEENTQRADLTWQEHAAAVARLQSLRNKQAAAAGEPRPSITEIATEVRGDGSGINRENTRREIIVAAHLDDPEVAGAKSVDEAFKALRRKENTAKARVLGEQVGRTFTADLHKAINANALEWLRDCPAEQFDVILTDPPYGMGADEFGDSGGRAAGAHGYKDSPENAEILLRELAIQSFRITKPQAHLYCFCDVDLFHWLRGEMSAAGWWVFRTPLIWLKRSGSRAPWPENGPQRKYEIILYAVKGKRTTLRMAGDVLDYAADSNLGHSAQKPVALYEDLLRRSVLPGNTVLDPFCGTGPIFPAAHASKCRATGVELDTGSYGLAVKRIEQLKAQKELDLSIGL